MTATIQSCLKIANRLLNIFEHSIIAENDFYCPKEMLQTFKSKIHQSLIPYLFLPYVRNINRRCMLIWAGPKLSSLSESIEKSSPRDQLLTFVCYSPRNLWQHIFLTIWIIPPTQIFEVLLMTILNTTSLLGSSISGFGWDGSPYYII